MTALGQPLIVYPIWKSDGTAQTLILQGNISDHADDPIDDHINHLQWAYDFRAVKGTDVHAVADGDIVYVNADVTTLDTRTFTGLGNVITVKSTDASGLPYYTTYAHLSSVLMASGHVTAGVVIAKSGDSGAPEAAHLHIQFGSKTYSTILDGATTGGFISGTVADGLGNIPLT